MKIRLSLNPLVLLLLSTFSFLLATGCGMEKESNFTGFGKPDNYHPFESVNVHGKWLADSAYAFSNCTECHGGDLKGVPVANDQTIRSCYTCHHRNHHIVAFDSSKKHGTYLAGKNWQIDGCVSCHKMESGAIAFGGTCKDCHKSTDHKVSFDSSQHHGSFLSTVSWKIGICSRCHQVTSTGANNWAGSCRDCHKSTDHKIGFQKGSDHIAYMRESGWNISRCSNCHNISGAGAIDWAGGCQASGCHTAPAGINNCNVCHGDFSADPADTLGWAPPTDLKGYTSTDSIGVGAHQAHLRAPSGIRAAVRCVECHEVPTPDQITAHLGTDPGVAEITFGALANNKGKVSAYDPVSGTCSNTYCHFSATPKWNQVDGTWSTCGSCHAMPPTTPPHWAGLTQNQCTMCHGSVINNQGEFIAPEKHVNGTIDRN